MIPSIVTELGGDDFQPIVEKGWGQLLLDTELEADQREVRPALATPPPMIMAAGLSKPAGIDDGAGEFLGNALPDFYCDKIALGGGLGQGRGCAFSDAFIHVTAWRRFGEHQRRSRCCRCSLRGSRGCRKRPPVPA